MVRLSAVSRHLSPSRSLSMQSIPFLRGIAVLALVALGACDTTRSPTAAEPAAGHRASTYLLASVSDSGGVPLVSWGAFDGATSYTVQLIFKSITYSPSGSASVRTRYFPVGTTTGLSLLDSDRAYTGVYTCTIHWDPVDGGGTSVVMYVYEVTATYPGGTSSSSPAAPVTECPE
jgi:hypothetical protein